MIRIVLTMIGWLICSHLYAQNLENHTWLNRVIIVKTKDEHSSKYQNQIQQFNNSEEELQDRKIVVYQIVGAEYSLKDYKNTDQEESGKLSLTLAKDILDDQNDFEVILIGLDGAIKLRKTDLLSNEELFNKIDSMPMRKAELRNRNRKN